MHRYCYLADTELISAHFTKFEGRIQIRRFYKHDSIGAVSLEIIDDGSTENSNNLSDVKERHIKKIQNTPTGLPKTIEEFAVNLTSGKEQFIRKKINQYDRHGWLTQQATYDCEGNLAYTLAWKHDSHGNIIHEKDALGHLTISKYDANDNLIFEHKPDAAPRVLTYDWMNRLISETQRGRNDEILKKSYCYDVMGNCISSTDIYGKATHREYDAQNRLTKTVHPASSTNAIATQIYTRNALGLATKIIDGNGHATHIEYNIRGKPIFVTHPDGKTESYIYTLWGELAESTARDGRKIRYTYDPMGREVKKEWFDKTSCSVKVITKSYDAFHLISETDGEGNITHYTYDAAGRLISERIQERKTLHSYDTLGRCTAIKKLLGEEKAISFVSAYDVLNRVIESYTEDANGETYERVLLCYDAQGREIKRIEKNQANDSVTLTQYDLFGREILSRNALGDAIHTSYHIEGKAPRQEVTDSRGVKTITSYDPFGKITLDQCYNPMGQLIRQIEYCYDQNGNKILRRIMTDKQPVETHWHYDSLNRLKETIDAVGTKDQKSTHREYTATGQLKKLIKNDGTVITFTYDALERKSSLHSSDGALYYTYDYDLNDNLIAAEDLVYQIALHRSYDLYGQLLSFALWAHPEL